MGDTGLVTIFTQTGLSHPHLFIHPILIYFEPGTHLGVGDISVKIQTKILTLMVLVFFLGAGVGRGT